MLPKPEDWGIDPLFWAHPALFVSQIHQLGNDVDNMCSHVLCNRHPITRAAILGVVVSIGYDSGKNVYHVDDTTGVIACIDFLYNSDQESLKRRHALPTHLVPEIKLGSLVRVLGTLRLIDCGSDDANSCASQTKRDETANGYLQVVKPTRMLFVENIRLVNDPNMELMHWKNVAKLTDEVYQKPMNQTLKTAWKENDLDFAMHSIANSVAQPKQSRPFPETADDSNQSKPGKQPRLPS